LELGAWSFSGAWSLVLGAFFRGAWILVLGAFVFYFVPNTLSWAQPASLVSPYEVKAAYLFNFAKYVEWPELAADSADDPIKIGILGRDPFGKTLEQVTGDRSINKRKIVIKRSSRTQDLLDCQIIFIGSSERERLPRIFSELKGVPALTVGEMPGFLENGKGMVQFVIVNDVVRFDINLENVERSGLKMSARLLTAARHVFRAAQTPGK
jgi:hypothetical protein